MTDQAYRHNPVAVFYGGYDQVALRRPPRLAVPKLAVGIAVATLALTVLVAADVSALANGPVMVRVTAVSWYADGGLLTTTPGFSVRASAETVYVLACDGLCFSWDGASASAPFQVVNFTVAWTSTAQYTNVTLRAPSTAYDGPLTITLDVTPVG